MISKRNLYLILPTVILVVFLNLFYISSLNRKIDNLESAQSENLMELESKNSQISTLSEQVSSMENIITILDKDLSDSQLNSSLLKAKTRELNFSILIQGNTIELLEEAIDIIGTGELGVALKAYGETVKELENLQYEYNRLLREYDKLLATQEA